MIKNTILLMLAGGFLFSSCKKHGCTDESAVNYSDLAKKDDGSCFFKSDINNVNSEIITIKSWEWSGDGNGYSVVKSTGIITKEIAESGLVQCLIVVDGEYIPLPYSAWSGSTWTSHYIFTYGVGEIFIMLQDDDGLTIAPSEDIHIKVVVASKNQIIDNPNIDWNNYEEVKQVL